MADETAKKDDAKQTGSAAAPAKKPSVPTSSSKPSKAKPASPDAAKPSAAGSKAPSKTEPVEAANSKKSKSSGFAWVLVFLLLFFIGGVAATPYVLPKAAPYMPAQVKAYFEPLFAAGGGADLADMTAKLNQLDAGLKDVRQMATTSQDALRAAPVASEVAAPADVTGLTARLDGLASQLEQVSQAQAGQSDAYARLQSSLNELPEGETGAISPAVVANLRAQLEESVSAREGLASTVEALSADVSALSASSAAASGNAASAEALSDVATAVRERLTRLEERLDVVAEAANSAADPQALESVNTQVGSALGDFESRLTALESVRQQATAAMVAGLETARLAQAVSNGRAFAAELKALTQLKAQAGPALPDIKDVLSDIAPYAETGIPSGAILSAQLEERAREILTAIDTPEGANWWESLLARIRNLVVVRKVGAGMDGADPTDILARAEVAARDGDWDAVVAEIDTLPNAAKNSFGAWWDHANARANAQRALADLGARLGVAATQTPGQTTGPAQ